MNERTHKDGVAGRTVRPMAFEALEGLAPATEVRDGYAPIVAAAVHAGHDLRPEVAERIALSDRERRYEEDPYTDGWTSLAPSTAVANRSRFEVDLNRPRRTAVYREPEHAWGLRVWKEPPPNELVERSLTIYDRFYQQVEDVLQRAERAHGRFVVYDLHSYNHRRGGPDASPADPASNPDVNLGTGSLDRGRWGSVADRFLEALRDHEAGGRPLDVRENVRFRGGHFPTWVNHRFPSSGCALAIEVKKIYMDEHTGELDEARWREIGGALAATVEPVLKALEQA